MQEQSLLKSLLKNKNKNEIVSAISELDEDAIIALMYDWIGIWARHDQVPPKELNEIKNIWLILAGRGWGKTRTGAEYVRELVNTGYKRIALIGPTPADVRDVMIEGESGIMNIFPPIELPVYEPSKRRLTFPTGAMATVYSGYKPDQLRGPQHDAFWADELASWQYLEETFDMLMFGLRLGEPRGIITTTPRPLPVIKSLMKADNVVITRGSTYDNRDNLAKTFFDAIIGKYEGTRLGRQELNAEILDDNPNALWTRDNIEKNRVALMPDMKRIVIAIDPNASDNVDSDEIGMIVAGIDKDNVTYVIDDISLFGSPREWGQQAISNYHKYKADRIVAEINNGGNMVEYVLYEQGKVKHVGSFPKLEDELCEWEQGMKSPNRLDALVWVVTDLALKGGSKLNSISKSLLGL